MTEHDSPKRMSLRPLLADGWREIRRHFLRWIYSVGAQNVLPFCEVAFIYLVYLVLQEEQRIALVAKIASYTGLDLRQWAWGYANLPLLLFFVGLALLLLYTLLRFTHEHNQIRLNYIAYVERSRRLITTYFSTPPRAVEQISRERIVDCIMNDCGVLVPLMLALLAIVASALTVALYFAAGTSVSWLLLAVAAALYGIPLWLTRDTYRKMQEIAVLKLDTTEKMLAYFGDTLRGYTRCRLDGLEGVLGKRSASLLHHSMEWRIRKRYVQCFQGIVLDGFPLLGLLATVYVGVCVLDAPVSDLMILMVIMNRMRRSVQIISSSLIRAKSYIPQAERYATLMSELSQVPAEEAPEQPARPIHKLELEGVDYYYGEKQVLSGVSLQLAAGDRVLLQGPSGHGKSTLLEILLGLRLPQAGAYRVDGENLTGKTFLQFRRSVSYVGPLVWIFNTTVLDNLLLADEEDEAGPRRALQQVGLHGPDGGADSLALDAEVGSNGELLSLGQRQRLLLARIFLKRATVLVLDEATANLDAELEERIMAQIRDWLPPDAIVVVVAHKPPAGITFNRHLILQDGKLKEVDRPS